MTVNRNKDADCANTLALLDRINRGVQVAATATSWLEHTKGAGQVDYELLWGATMERMSLHTGAVKQHMRHLEIEHGLKVVERNGIYRLVVTALDN